MIIFESEISSSVQVEMDYLCYLYYYFQAERSEMPIYGNVIQVVKKNNGEIEAIPEDFKINFDFEQKEKIYREEIDNNFFINPSLIELGDTLYSPFITSRKNTISLSLTTVSLNLKKHSTL